MYHIWTGRLLITFGMINGGLGLLLSGDGNRREYVAYGVIASVMWISWIVIVLAVSASRGMEIPGTIDREKRALNDSARSAPVNSLQEAYHREAF